ncbi:MAG TPA: hypothetical protein VN939_18305 [Chthoniobacterales bacterium]|nr:hypothetical protein [Chthoniobacterales bacterium]
MITSQCDADGSLVWRNVRNGIANAFDYLLLFSLLNAEAASDECAQAFCLAALSFFP